FSQIRDMTWPPKISTVLVIISSGVISLALALHGYFKFIYFLVLLGLIFFIASHCYYQANCSIIGHEKAGRSVIGQEKPGRSVIGQDKPDWSVIGQEKPGRSVIGQDKPGRSVIGQEKPGRSVIGQEKPGRSVIGQDKPGRSVIGQDKPDWSVIGQDKPGRSVIGQEKFGSLIYRIASHLWRILIGCRAGCRLELQPPKALLCKNCGRHNGLALASEALTMSWRCADCGHFHLAPPNPAAQTDFQAPTECLLSDFGIGEENHFNDLLDFD
ncbi:hypothetical protein BOX15_Mlig001720g2, partial [Macrostomum lignano]